MLDGPLGGRLKREQIENQQLAELENTMKQLKSPAERSIVQEGMDRIRREALPDADVDRARSIYDETIDRLALQDEEEEVDREAAGAEPREQPKQHWSGDGNTRVSEEERKRCPVAPYWQLKGHCPPGQQAHHILPDRVFRQAGPGTERIDKAPSYANGLAVCVQSNLQGPDSEHSKIHNRYFDQQAEDESLHSTPQGLITLARAEDIASDAMDRGTDGRCSREYVRSQLRTYHQNSFHLEPDTLVRGQRQPLDSLQNYSMGTQRNRVQPR